MFDLHVPNFNKKRSSKDLILEVLSIEWPLSLKEIYNYCKKEFKYSGSYQSIFKSINELIANKILTKKDKLYEINISWIKNLQSWTDVVETNYYSESRIKDFSKKSSDISIINFNSVFDCEKYLYYFVKNELKKMKDKRVVYEMNNLWKVLFYMRAEYNYYTKLIKLGHEFLFLTRGNSEIENQAKTFYKKIGISVRNKKEESPMDTIVFGKYYIQIFIPENLREKINKFLNNNQEMNLLEILDNDANVKVVIHEDLELANGLLEKLWK